MWGQGVLKNVRVVIRLTPNTLSEAGKRVPLAWGGLALALP